MTLTLIILLTCFVVGHQIYRLCPTRKQRLMLIVMLLISLLYYLARGSFIEQAWLGTISSHDTKRVLATLKHPDKIIASLHQHCEQQDAKACYLAAGIALQNDQSKLALKYAEKSYQLDTSSQHLERLAISMVINKQPFTPTMIKHLTTYAQSEPKAWILIATNHMRNNQNNAAKKALNQALIHATDEDKKIIKAQLNQLNKMQQNA